MANWNLEIDLSAHIVEYKSGIYGIPQLAEKVADQLLESGWLKLSPYPDTLKDTIAALKNADSRDDYLDRFEAIYDKADEDFVWIRTST